MKIVIKTHKNEISGRTVKVFDIEVDDSCTIEKIKQQIQTKTGISLSGQSLFFDGKQLEDKLRLSNYRIQKESVVDVVYRGKKRLID
jgi:hypothetical protein